MADTPLRISILGIGTELTTGQILNRNGPWISGQVQNLGVNTSVQLVVPDEKNLILEALQFCAEHSEVLFVTGGLGPTSDDFTRDVISEWTQTEMQWSEASWKHIQDRLGPRGIAIRDIQKQQCYFPQGAEILVNKLGTANAFFMQKQISGKELWIFVLPGPPKEIEGLWNDFIFEKMKQKAKDVDGLITKSWDTIGFGESDIADLAETALKGCHYEKGYRVHLPYVEFKMSYLKSQHQEAQAWINKIESALGPMTALRDGEDLAQKLSCQLSAQSSVWIEDFMPGSFLMQRLFPFSKVLLQQKKLQFSNGSLKSAVDHKTLHLSLKETSPGHARAQLTLRGQTRLQDFSSPYRSILLKEREHQYFAEMALLFWRKELENESV